MTLKTTKKSSKRSYTGLSVEERKLARRECFLDAGLEVFGKAGIRRATVRKLCKEAQLTERYFYESFEDSEALFCAVYEKQVDVLRNKFIAIFPELPEELGPRIRACLDLYFSLMRDERVVRVLYVESLLGIEKVDAVRQQNNDVMAHFAAHWMKQDNPDLDVTFEFASSVSMGINGACFSMATQWMLGSYRVPQEVLVESCSLLVRGTMRELTKKN